MKLFVFNFITDLLDGPCGTARFNYIIQADNLEQAQDKFKLFIKQGFVKKFIETIASDKLCTDNLYDKINYNHLSINYKKIIDNMVARYLQRTIDILTNYFKNEINNIQEIHTEIFGAAAIEYDNGCGGVCQVPAFLPHDDLNNVILASNKKFDDSEYFNIYCELCNELMILLQETLSNDQITVLKNSVKFYKQ